MIIPKFVGLLTCSGEEYPAGSLSRAATRLVIQEYLKGSTTTICVPLFLSGDKEERNFVKNFPCISIDGCSKACAKKGVEMMLNGKSPTESIILSDVFTEKEFEEIMKGPRHDKEWVDHPYTKKLAARIADVAIKYLK